MNSGRFAKYALILSLALLPGCEHTTIYNNGSAVAKTPSADLRSNRGIEKLLPPSVFDQKEFPKSYVIGMMRTCLNSVKERHSISYQAGKSDSLCACETDARVHRFTMQEYIEAGQAAWDPRVVPDAAKKSATIITECLQKVLP